MAGLSVTLVAAANAGATLITFSAFGNGSDIAAGEGGNQSAIAFNHTGTGFVGSVYFGPDNNQLFSTNLSGGGVAQYGQPTPDFSGEVVIGVGLGHLLRPKQRRAGAVRYYRNVENIRQIFLVPGNTFGAAMLVSTSSGRIYSFNSAGAPTLIGHIGTDTEGTDIAGASGNRLERFFVGNYPCR